ncbi:hypothetical protein TIFTF001_016514 [Ficus carica]|uniref:Uncharacterized protein n=1 Tax=Ficus carica TaxID=3494 RepID=A0AA88ATE0_FICCA|nr:hypothetical protein TIFTF001_016514 [Ficus carica]
MKSSYAFHSPTSEWALTTNPSAHYPMQGAYYNLAIPQLMSNNMKVFLGLIIVADKAGVELTVEDFLALYYPKENENDFSRYSMYPRRKNQIVGGMVNADSTYVVGKVLKKTPPKALLFEAKLEHLLAMPDRGWDDIQIPHRLRQLSLWKGYIELPSGIDKRIPSWVDWPFVIKRVLKRLFGTPLFIEPLTDEEALFVDLALDMILSAKSKRPEKNQRRRSRRGRGTKDGRVQDHLDEFSWDNLKARAEKLLKSKHQFKEACAKAENLAKEFFSFENMVKEGAKLLNQMGEKNKELVTENDVLKQTIKQKDVDIKGLVACVVDEYEKATLKARYELLKEYKEGLHTK